MQLKRVVVTGMGALTPLGNSLEAYWEGLISGRSGAAPITQFDATLFKTQFACELKGFNVEEHMDKKEARKLDQFSQYAMVSSTEAMADSGLMEANPNLDRIGVIWGSGIGGLKTFQEEAREFFRGDGTPRFNPFFIPKMIADIAAGHISIKYGLRGPNYVTVSACASSTNAIIDAFNLIRLGKADIIVSTLLESAKYLNKSALRRQKYNLIKEIKANYNVDEFFKTKLPNYKTQAAFYTLLEMYDGVNQPEPNQVISNKLILLEHLTSAPVTTVAKDTLMEEFKSYDKDIRMLTYRALLEKFNSKYANLNEGQKSVLKEFINSVDNPSKLKDFYNTKITEIKSDLTKLNKKVKDKTTQIKINEVSNILVTLDKNDKISNDDMTNLLHYYELLEELRKVNG